MSRRNPTLCIIWAFFALCLVAACGVYVTSTYDGKHVYDKAYAAEYARQVLPQTRMGIVNYWSPDGEVAAAAVASIARAQVPSVRFVEDGGLSAALLSVFVICALLSSAVFRGARSAALREVDVSVITLRTI